MSHPAAQLFLTLSVLLTPFSLPIRAQEIRDEKGNVYAELTKVSRLPYRWEFDPDIDVRWSLSKQPPPLEVPSASLVSGSERECLQTAERIHRSGTRGIADAAEVYQSIHQRLQNEGNSRTLELALVSAAVQIHDKKEDIDFLWAIVRSKPLVRRIVEGALIKTQSTVALEFWREHVQSSTLLADQMLAIKGIGACGAPSDSKLLIPLLTNPSTALPVQMTAAKSLGSLVPRGLAAADLRPLAQELLAGDRPQAELLVANLLKHDDQMEGRTVERLLKGTNGPAQQITFANLMRHQPSLAEQNLADFLKHPDPAGRDLALRFVYEKSFGESLKNKTSILRNALGDPNEKVRVNARSMLLSIHKSEPEEVVAEAKKALTGGNALAQEQACILAGEAGMEQLSSQLYDLLSSESVEVRASAAWGVQRATSDKAILDSLEAFAQQRSESDLKSGSWPTPGDTAQLAYLFETLGKNRIAKSEKMLRRYFSKESAPPQLRASAIWALGMLKENSADGRLAGQLEQRLHDDSDLNPEHMVVKYVSAISMARIGADSSFSSLESHYERPPFPVGLARQWAMRQLSSGNQK
ncbi:MAG: hypothetical protein AAF483_02590 [Planctomycetota bacterium]